MPELPEVETVVRGLQGVLPGRRIVGVRLGKTDFIDDPDALERELPGTYITSVERQGKFLVLNLEGAPQGNAKLALLIHLGMTGQLTTCAPEFPAPLHTHVFISLDDGRELRYRDIRRFGRIRVQSNTTGPSPLASLGIDPLAATADEFQGQLGERRARIKALLLDQRVFSGIGNIYADESLWRARIHPARLGANLSEAEIARLRSAVRRVLEEAIRLKGSSVSDYVDVDGLPGEFQLRHRVYQRQGKKCSRCGATIRRLIVAGRSSHFCPQCQRGPRKTKAKASN
jgi:formamidopyrimidine-DNA glycosylase